MTPTLETLRAAVAEVRRLDAARTQGPWELLDGHGKSLWIRGRGPVVSGCIATIQTDWVHADQQQEQRDNAAFLAHAPQTAALAVQLLDALESAERDAARYRWLREGDNDESCVKIIQEPHDSDPYAFLLRDEELDAAIDAAMLPAPPAPTQTGDKHD